MLLFRKKGPIFQDCSSQGYPTTTTSRAPKGRRRRRRGRTKGGGDGGGAVGSSMLIVLWTTLKVLSIFLLAPSAATPCTSSACSSTSTIPLQDIPSKVRDLLVQSQLSELSHPTISFSTAGSKSSSYFFSPVPLFPTADDDEPLALRPVGRPPDRPGPHAQDHHCMSPPCILTNPPRPASPGCPNPLLEAVICAVRSRALKFAMPSMFMLDVFIRAAFSCALLTAVEPLLLVLSCMWLCEDERNFSGPSRSGSLPASYRSFNLAVARSTVCLWLVPLLLLSATADDDCFWNMSRRCMFTARPAVAHSGG